MSSPIPPSPIDHAEQADVELRERLARAIAPAYVLDGEIGRGGMGVVYEAVDARLKRKVAIKLLPPDLAYRADVRTRFLREAETSARLSHPHIVPIYAVDERDGLVYFVMALVEGESVGQRMRRTSGAMSAADTRRIMREVADALAYAHARGVIHRDIKPDNILLDGADGRAMVTDFGIARATSESATQLTATGAALGTPLYMSPEQCVADNALDGRADLYSLGAVAYHMLVGQPPFTGGNTPAIMVKQVTEAPVAVRRHRPEVPLDLERIVMRLLEKDPSRRFADGAALIAALDGAPLSPLPGGETPSVTPLALPQLEKLRDRMRVFGLDVPIDGQALRQLEKFRDRTRVIGLGATMDGRALRLEPRLDDLVRKQIVEKIESAASRHEERVKRRLERLEERRLRKESKTPASVPERVYKFRRNLAGAVMTSASVFAINAMTGHDYWWAIWPTLAVMTGVLSEGGTLWAAGARLSDVFGRSRTLPEPPRSANAPPVIASSTTPSSVSGASAPDVSQEVLVGPRGDVVRQAFADRRSIHDLVARLSETERQMLPDAKGSADALYERIVALAAALSRLDAQVDPTRLPALQERIAKLEQAEGGSEAERRLGLLRRQRDMLADLVRSRDALAEQYESAGLLLENLALDLLKVRSSGLKSAIEGVTSVTQEARALSREIGYVLDAAEELRAIDRRSEG